MASEERDDVGAAELAKRLGVSLGWVQRRAAQGFVPGRKDAAGQWRFSLAEVERKFGVITRSK